MASKFRDNTNFYFSDRKLSTIPYRFLEVYKRIPSSEFPVDNRIAWSIFIGKTNKELLHFCDKYFPIVQRLYVSEKFKQTKDNTFILTVFPFSNNSTIPLAHNCPINELKI